MIVRIMRACFHEEMIHECCWNFPMRSFLIDLFGVPVYVYWKNGDRGKNDPCIC